MHPAAADHRRDDLHLSQLLRLARRPGRGRAPPGRPGSRGSSFPRRRSSRDSQAGATHVACRACSTVCGLLGPPGGSLVDRPAARRRRSPPRGSSSSTGASEPLATTRAGLEQRPEGIRARRGGRARALGEVTVGGRMGELDRTSDAEGGEPRHSSGARPARARSAAAALGPTRRVSPRTRRARSVRPVADRVHPDRPAAPRPPRRTISSSSSRLVISTPAPSIISAVCEPSVPSMKPFR